jgi:hypothetical protein
MQRELSVPISLAMPHGDRALAGAQRYICDIECCDLGYT